MPTNLLLLPLVGGYWFLHTLYYTRLRSQRLDGYRLLVESALMGIVLVVVARPLVVGANACSCVRSTWVLLAPQDIPYLGTALAASVLGFVLPHSLNIILDRTGWLTKQEANYKSIMRHGSHLLRLLHSASAQEKPVSVTLDNNKVYIGLVAGAPNLEPHDAHLSITPFFSGYRVNETLELRLNVDYLKVYEEHGLDPQEFRVVVPMSNIRMASLFDHSVYPAFLVESEDEPTDERGATQPTDIET